MPRRLDHIYVLARNHVQARAYLEVAIDYHRNLTLARGHKIGSYRATMLTPPQTPRLLSGVRKPPVYIVGELVAGTPFDATEKEATEISDALTALRHVAADITRLWTTNE